MFQRIGRAWQTWRDKSRLVAPFMTPAGVFIHIDLRFPELVPVAKAGGPELEPYQGMAEAWDAYTAPRLPDYASYLQALYRRGAPVRSVLDLACGTGVLSGRLARVAEEVVGLDASEAMLAVARNRADAPAAVSYVHGDFREFALGREFDAAVCAFNSLNYVANRGELNSVFAAVGRHLRPGGAFVFDTMSLRGMRQLSGLHVHHQNGDRRFALRFRFDEGRRSETALAILPTGVEMHRRIPIDPPDVAAAADGTGLEMVDYFSNPLLPRDWGHGLFYFFVLSKRG